MLASEAGAADWELLSSSAASALLWYVIDLKLGNCAQKSARCLVREIRPALQQSSRTSLISAGFNYILCLP